MSKKLFLSKRSFFLFFSLLMVIVGIVFKGPVFHYALKKYVSYKIPLEGEWDFNYSYMSLGDKGIAFHDICLESKDRAVTCKIGKIFCYAPELEKISLTNHYVVEDLDLVFTKQMEHEKSTSPDQMRSILRSLRQVEIKSGSIQIPSKKMQFSLKKSISAQKLGALIFSEPLQGLVKVELSSWADRWIIDIEARQSSIGYFKEFVDFFMGGKSSDWKIEKGKLDGRVFIAISADNSVKDARIHMNLLDGKAINNNAGISTSFDRVFIDMNYPISSEANSIIDNIKISSSMDKGEIHVFNEVGDTRFHFKDLSGFITMDAFKEAAVDITGFIDDKGKLLPVKLLGSPAKKQERGLELDLSLQLDTMFGHKAHVNVICTHEKGEFLLKSRLDSLEVRQMLIMQVCLGLFDPAIKEYTISKGTYSGDVLMAFNNEGIKEFSLRNLLCDDLGIYSEKKDIRLEAKKVSGELEIDLFREKKTVLSAWEMEFIDASCIIGREDKVPYHFENTHVKIVSKDGKFLDSFISTEINGVKGRADIDGTLEHPVIDFMLTAKGDDVLQWITDPSGTYLNEVMVSSRIEKLGDEFFGSGIVTLHQGEHSSEVAFDVKGQGDSVLDISFQSKDFSGIFYPFCNEVIKFDWSIDGDFSFEGNYNKEKLSCEFSGKNVCYKEEHSLIKNASGTGYLEKNFKTNTWFVDLSLCSGNKKLFEGKDFFLENADIRLSSEDTFFKVRSLEGYMDIDKSIPRLYARLKRFDITKDNVCFGDITFHNEDFELARFCGMIKDQNLFLDDYSHFLEEKIILHECSFKEGMKISLESILHLDDIAFPKRIRDENFSDVFWKLTIDGSAYQFDAKNKESTFALQGVGKDYKIAYNDVTFMGSYEDGMVNIGEGEVDFSSGKIQIKKASFDKNSFFIDGKVEDDHFFFEGNVEGSFADGLALTGKGMGSYRILGHESFVVKSKEPFSFVYDKKGTLNGGNFSVSENGLVLGEFKAKSIGFHDDLKKISLHALEGTVKKNVLEEKLGMQLLEDDIHFFAEADILPMEKDFWFSGRVDQNKILAYGNEILMDSIKVRGNKKSLVVDCSVPVYDTKVDITSHLFFEDKIIFHIDGLFDDKKVLEIDGQYKDSLELYRIKGDLVGACFDITPSIDIGGSDYKVEATLDLQKMRPLFSAGALEFVDKMRLGKGLEIIGGVKYKDGFSFDGIMKGTDFDFLDFSLSSLFGKFSYKNGLCTVTDFSVADRSFIASCEKATFDTAGEGCLFTTKEFKVRSLRPCLLSKKGERKKLSNPFMLEKIDFLDVKGDLADINTITGKGSINFINSFDKETNPLFDFAKEIIGRIGLDPVLMVPVEGKLEFTLGGGKMNFIKMLDSYSDQKRSYFFLWHKTPAYIDFNGNINIDIRMKQYVLFKFTQLFIISLDGTLSDPKVHLK